MFVSLLVDLLIVGQPVHSTVYYIEQFDWLSLVTSPQNYTLSCNKCYILENSPKKACMLIG